MLAIMTLSFSSAAQAQAQAQSHRHTPGMAHVDDARPSTRVAVPGFQGLSAFATIAEVIRLLAADSTTDWSKVNIEALREHLRDMDDVTLRTSSTLEPVPGGARFTVTGTGRTIAAIRRMAGAHGRVLRSESGMLSEVEDIPGGARVTVIASPADAALTRRIRALGFVGVLTLGFHHDVHHLAIARGDAPSHRH